MRPDFSVLLLTTLIGAGQEFFLALVTVQLYALFGLLPALMGTIFLFGLAQLAGWNPMLLTLPSRVVIDATVVLGIAGTVLAFAHFLCTAMIYACLPFLREWATPLTVINYTLLGGASGFTLAAAFAGLRRPG